MRNRSAADALVDTARDLFFVALRNP